MTTHETTLKVRDYECDAQGIVNNANYQHYTEHARHEFLRSRGLIFADLHDRGIDPVVARISLEYKTPLRGGDEMCLRLRVEKEGIRYVFHQDIYRLPDMKLACRAKVEIACLINGRLAQGHPDLDALLAPTPSSSSSPTPSAN